MLLQTLLKHITTIVDSAVIKYSTKAQDLETANSLRVADYYMAAIENLLTFSSFDKFHAEAIVDSGMPTYTTDDSVAGTYTAETYAANKSLIPYEYRDAVVRAQNKIIISEYEYYGDGNDYYRELAGLPSIDAVESDLIKLSSDEYAYYGVEPNTYLYEITDAQYISMLDDGVIDRVIAEHPDLKYLQHIGYKKIDTVKARRANNFAILYAEAEDIPTTFYELFNREYERNREYVCTVLYNRSLSGAYPLYDNFMALCVMFMTIQRVVSLSFKQGIERDLYDWDFIQNLYAAYRIPFIEKLPIETHVTMMKNFNNLLRHKSTDKVFYDLKSLLGYTNLSFEKYILVKTPKLDVNGNPDIVYNDDGTINYDETFDLYFKTVDISEKNILLALQETHTKKTYEEVTESDPLWWDSGDLKQTILEDDFNYRETKYISMTVMFNMSEMMFNISYAIQLLLDKKEDIEDYNIGIDLPKIRLGKKFSIFNICVALIAGIAKMRDPEGPALAIPSSESKIMHIYGYRNKSYDDDMVDYLLRNIVTGSPDKPGTNGSTVSDNAWKLRYKHALEKTDIPYDTVSFEYTDQSTGKESINSRSYMVDRSWRITSAKEFNNLFNNIREYNDALINAMWNTTDINVYTAYRALYDVSMTKTAVDTMFTKKNGLVASTYLDYLEDADTDLYSKIAGSEDDALYDVLNHIVTNLESKLDSIKDLEFIIDSGSGLYEAIMALVNFFKSYTVDIHSFNIWYLFDSKIYNTIRLFETADFHAKLWMPESLNLLYGDTSAPKATLMPNDNLNIKDTIKIISEGS